MWRASLLLVFLFSLLIHITGFAADQRHLYRLPTGDDVFRQGNSIGIKFNQPRSVLSTSIINGGLRNDLQGVFNHNSTDMVMTVEAYVVGMRQEAESMGLSPDRVSSMGTGARMDNVAIKSASYQGTEVTAIVTAGVEGNAGRVGDPTNYHNPKAKPNMPRPGTINIMLIINVDMPPGTLARALVTCTEAKTAALQELLVGSRYSNGLATGSGTDQTIVVANPEAELYLDDAGKHSKLGELIGLAVKDAVKEALVKQNHLTAQKQHDVLRRMARFGLTGDRIYQDYLSAGYAEVDKETFLQQLATFAQGASIVTGTSLYVHLLDQYNWGLLTADEVAEAGAGLIATASRQCNIVPGTIGEHSLKGFVEAWEHVLLACMNRKLSQ